MLISTNAKYKVDLRLIAMLLVLQVQINKSTGQIKNLDLMVAIDKKVRDHRRYYHSSSEDHGCLHKMSIHPIVVEIYYYSVCR